MASVAALKQAISNYLPDDAGEGGKQKIAPAKHRELDVAFVDELSARGLFESATVANLANIPGTETNKVLVPGYGVFKFVANGLVADNVTIFAAQTSGFWQLQKSFVHKTSVVLAPAVSIAIDLTQGDVFKLSIDRDTLLDIPSGVKWNGKKIRFQITQTGAGSFQALFNTNAGGYCFSTTHPEPDFTGHEAGTISWLEFEYSTDISKWVCIGHNYAIVP